AVPAGAVEFSWLRLGNAGLGTIIVASGAAAFKQWLGPEFDAHMRRTPRRPGAAGGVQPRPAATFAPAFLLAGLGYLYLAVGILPLLLALATLSSYLFLYTPAKRITPLCTLIGAVPGAMPTLIGWTAAEGRISLYAFALFAIVFLWQFPHFMAIA